MHLKLIGSDCSNGIKIIKNIKKAEKDLKMKINVEEVPIPDGFEYFTYEGTIFNPNRKVSDIVKYDTSIAVKIQDETNPNLRYVWVPVDDLESCSTLIKQQYDEQNQNFYYDSYQSVENDTYKQSICGEDKSNNINKLKKLVIYLDGSDKKVTKEIIDKVCSRTLNAKIFDVLNLIVNRKKEEAIKKLNDLLEQKEPIVKIYIMLYKQIYQMYLIKYAKQNNILDIAKLFGIHPYTYKNLSISADKYTLNKLKEILYSFDEYDEKTKNGEMDFEIGLKKIICSM